MGGLPSEPALADDYSIHPSLKYQRKEIEIMNRYLHPAFSSFSLQF
jgi:hypothetical protein